MITVGGLHGTGKSTYAKVLSDSFHLRHISAGAIFRRMFEEKKLDINAATLLAARDSTIDREIDRITAEEAASGSVVIDGQLAAWMAREHASVKFFLSARDETRFRRIAERDKISFEEARRLTLEREEVEKERYRRYYNINIDDLSIYDLILNTELLPIKSNIRILTETVEEYLKFNQPTRR